MKLTDVKSLPITSDDELTSLDEIETAQWAAGLPSGDVPSAIVYEWGNFQQIPSYVEQQAKQFSQGL